MPDPGNGSLLPITVRPMRASDIETVTRIERQSFSTSWTVQAYLNELSNPAAIYLVAAVGDRDAGTERIIGYGGLWLIMDEAHITTIAVIPELRGRKIGDRILCRMLQSVLEKGGSRATLEVRETNLPARKLYEKYGFEYVAVRKRYYEDTGENAEILWINDMLTPEWKRLFAANRAAVGL